MSSYTPSSESGTDDAVEDGTLSGADVFDTDDFVLSAADAVDDWPLSGADVAPRLGPGRTLRNVNVTGAAPYDDEGDSAR